MSHRTPRAEPPSAGPPPGSASRSDAGRDAPAHLAVGEPARLPYHALIWLAVATFSTGIDGYVLAGLLPDIARDLSVSEAVAGQLVTAFALTAALAGPLLGALTSGREQRATIMAALAAFIAGNVVSALAPTYAVALGGRIIAALGACILGAAVTGYVVHLVPERSRGRALSFVLGGWMTATALGVPVGLLLGQSSWRVPLLMVAAVGTLALIGIAARLPALRYPPTRLRERLQPLLRPRLVAGLLVSTGVLCASYTCFTYAVLILGPVHPQAGAIILIMLGYGLASMLGNAVSGRLVDRFDPVRVLTAILLVLLADAVLAGTAFSVLGAGAMAAATLAWFLLAGIGNGAHAVPQQARLAAMAPASASVVMALNASAISLGVALGGGAGGLGLALGMEAVHLPWIAATLLTATLALHLVVARWSRRPHRLPG
ncbi:MFS transporter [Brachybacterium phenoliresistens]|uniref:MFS transporter n=1 Tax=Brachybacterium phenoliresistens TaxID=396014 RepID=UPI0031E1FA4A